MMDIVARARARLDGGAGGQPALRDRCWSIVRDTPTVYGYLGPCTQFDDTYQVTVYALGVGILPGLTAVTHCARGDHRARGAQAGFAVLLGTASL